MISRSHPLLFAIILLAVAVCSSVGSAWQEAGTASDRPLPVSLIQLIATPDAFHGKYVMVHGFVRIEHEGSAVYLHRDDCEHMLTRNGLWLAASDSAPEGSKEAQVNNRYALLVGQFNAKSKGHRGLWSGSIEKIARMEAWNIRKDAGEPAKQKPPAQKNGLSLNINFSKQRFHTREPVFVSFQLKNESAKDMYIGDGWMGPAYQETGPVRHFELRVNADGQTPLRFWSGTMTEGGTSGIRKVFKLKPGEVYAGKIRISAGVESDLGYAWRPHEIRGGIFEVIAADKKHAFGADAKKYSFVMRYQVSPETHGVWQPPKEFKEELLWKGVLDSHPVEIEIAGMPPPLQNVLHVESKPVEMTGLEFVAVTEAVWVWPEAEKVQDVQIGLRITNRSKEVKTLDLFDDLRHLGDDAGRSRAAFPRRAARYHPFQEDPLACRANHHARAAGPIRMGSREKDRSLYFGGTDGVGGAWSAGDRRTSRQANTR